jgi:hypothetical protein
MKIICTQREKQALISESIEVKYTPIVKDSCKILSNLNMLGDDQWIIVDDDGNIVSKECCPKNGNEIIEY